VVKKKMNEFKKLLGIIFTFGIILLTNGMDRVYAYDRGQSIGNVSSGSAYNALLQGIGVGDGDSEFDTIEYKVLQDSGSTTPVNAGSFRVWELGLDYKSTYPAPYIYPSSITCNPSNRCTGSPINAITSGSDPVYVTAHFSAGNHLQVDHKYVIGFTANNAGNKVHLYGSSGDVLDGSCYYEDTGNMLRVDDYGDHDAFYVNKCAGVEDIYFSINGYLPPSVIQSGSAIANPLDQSALINLQGTMPVSSSQRLDILVWSSCTKSGYASYHSTTPDAHIEFYSDDCKTETIDRGNGYYYGVGWCYDPLDNSWSADGIEVPFPTDGYTCEYPVTFNLYEWSTSTRRYELIESGDIGTIGAITSGSSPTEPEPTDPIAWLAWKVKQILLEVFGFAGVDVGRIGILQDQLELHAPFAYGMAIFNFDTTAPLSSTSTPSLTLAFAPINGTSSPSFTWNGNAGVDTMLTSVRSVVSILLWCGLVAYIVLRVRSFSEKL
jgi:hypothetical protein